MATWSGDLELQLWTAQYGGVPLCHAMQGKADIGLMADPGIAQLCTAAGVAADAAVRAELARELLVSHSGNLALEVDSRNGVLVVKSAGEPSCSVVLGALGNSSECCSLLYSLISNIMFSTQCPEFKNDKML